MDEVEGELTGVVVQAGGRDVEGPVELEVGGIDAGGLSGEVLGGAGEDGELTKMSFCAPVGQQNLRSIPIKSGVKVQTIRPAQLHVVPRALRKAISLVTTSLDVVAIELMPVNHLLGALGACRWISFAPYTRLRRGNRSCASSASHLASVAGHVHVGLSTSVRDPARND